MATTSAVRCAAIVVAASTLLASCAKSSEKPSDTPDRSFGALRTAQLRAAGLDEVSPPLPAPASLLQLDYDGYRRIAYRPHKALWRDTGLPFEIAFYHPGYLFERPVRIRTVEPSGTRVVPFDADRFDYGLEGGAAQWSRGVDGYAGFLALHPFDGGPWRESASFLGGCYFRAIGSQHIFGASARALAIDIASPREETFPRFTDFWIRKPLNGDATLEVSAVVESPQIVGAYEFDVTPGATTTVDVRAELFCRADAGKVALAPLTSMFWHRPGDELNSTDFRPRVHDSEGLLVQHAGGEWLWRPVANPAQGRVSIFAGDVVGYGLVQRHRDAGDFLDNEALYHRRPSVWVEPAAGFDGGSLELLELHAVHEGVDNLGAYWVLPGGMKAGERRTVAWRLTFQDADPPAHAGAKSAGFMIGGDPQRRRVRIAFRGGFLEANPDVAALAGDFTALNAQVEEVAVERIESGVYALQGTVVRGGEAPVEMRAFLRSAGGDATETWTWRDDGT